VFSFAAAVVTLAAADETDRAVAAPAAVPVAAVVRRAVRVPVARAPAARAPVARVPVARLAVAGDPAVLAAFACWRAGFVAAVSVGTEVPPSRSVTGNLIPHDAMFYTWW
jgi:MFS-type transporter involved in bile tolerance (Atg22 family)